jgi:uncharacterized membrane protein (DUF106 family)
MAFQELLNPIMSPLLKLNPFFAIVLISFLISLLIVLVYKKFTDQDLMKRLKAEIKEFQAEMKTLKKDPNKMMQVQKKAMETNTKYMMHSFKPTLFTFIPIILIFGWLNAHMGYYPLVEDQQFGIEIMFEEGKQGSVEMIPPDGLYLVNENIQTILNDKVQWALKGDAQQYTIDYKFINEEFSHSVIINEKWEDRKYSKPDLKNVELGLDKKSNIKTLTISNKKVQPFKEVPLLGNIPWFGNFGWLGTYIVFSIAFSIGLRKLLKVY